MIQLTKTNAGIQEKWFDFQFQEVPDPSSSHIILWSPLLQKHYEARPREGQKHPGPTKSFVDLINYMQSFMLCMSTIAALLHNNWSIVTGMPPLMQPSSHIISRNPSSTATAAKTSPCQQIQSRWNPCVVRWKCSSFCFQITDQCWVLLCQHCERTSCNHIQHEEVWYLSSVATLWFSRVTTSPQDDSINKQHSTPS